MSAATVHYAYESYGELSYEGDSLAVLTERRDRLGLTIQIVRITTEVVA